ncbi:ABC transporter permease subunit [Inmirania thermothiophila]|uniref:ABC-2 type transport system permease protein n=1 Tax=Inmirania thermothiophila TaxID=1750597 RepID=A0A3N1Y9I0_9GAMM|nr:ABC transporter permease subunit [Inmirania thermothiophila]ROR34272.1 ABC-2 type transport system permease protein [Inmirania thermothiophila]
MTVWAIARRELRSLFLSPMAWAILAVLQFLLAWMFLAQVETFLLLQPQLMTMEGAPGVTDVVVAPLLGNAAVVLLLVTPLITMRLVAEERRAGTLTLLYSAPVSMTEIALGKYLGVILFLLCAVGLVALMPLALLAGGALDGGKVAAGLLGLALLLAAFAAVGLYMSSLTAQPVVAAVSTFGVLLLLWIADWARNVRPEVDTVLGYLSLVRHYENLLKGLVDTGDLAYYGLLVVTFLALTVRRLDGDRFVR